MTTIKEKELAGRGGSSTDRNIEKLALHLERSEFQEYLYLLGNPRRLLWVNFLAGVSRGVGMLIGGGIIGTIILGIAIGVLAWGMHKLGGLPWVGVEFQKLVLYISNIVAHRK